MSRAFQIGFIALILTSSAWALRWTKLGSEPVKDEGWPEGVLVVANLPVRIGWMGGDGGWSSFVYQSDEKALQEALDLFAKVKSPELRLILHSGREQAFGMQDPRKPNADLHTDWSLTVYSPTEFSRRRSMLEAAAGEMNQSPPPPTIDVYVGGGGIVDWSKIKVPENLKVTDERADANGITGPAIRGTVLGGPTTQPIAGATIGLENYDADKREWKPITKTVSDGNGKFSFTKVPLGTNRMAVAADGQVPRLISVSIRENAVRDVDANLAPAVKIGGMVVDDDGKPLAGVAVRSVAPMGSDGQTYQMPDEMGKITTDDRGRFVLDRVPAGPIQLRAVLDHYYQLGVLSVLTAPSDTVTIRMTRTGSVKGTLMDQLGNPVLSGTVNVRAQGEQGGKWGGGSQVQPDGTFEFKNVPPGDYIISTTAGPLIAEDPLAKKFTVKADQTVEVILGQPARGRRGR